MVAKFLGNLLGRKQGAAPAPPALAEPPGQPAGWALRDLMAASATDAKPAPGATAPPPPATQPAPAADPPPANEDNFPPDRFGLLAVANRVGSVEHYFHFILGYVAPIMLRPAPAPGAPCQLARSCGPLDPMFAELALPDIRQIPKLDWRRRRETNRYRLETVIGYDSPEHYDPAAFAVLRAAMLAHFGMTAPDKPDRTLLVNRGQSPEAYQAADVENPTSANLRRSVPNMAEVCAAITQAGHACDMVELETNTLRMQLALFAGTRTLVAQHGAALVNMLWMAPGGTIVEILPNNLGRTGRIFRMLAEACGHGYVCVPQATLHAAVDADAVVAALRKQAVLF